MRLVMGEDVGRPDKNNCMVEMVVKCRILLSSHFQDHVFKKCSENVVSAVVPQISSAHCDTSQSSSNWQSGAAACAHVSAQEWCRLLTLSPVQPTNQKQTCKTVSPNGKPRPMRVAVPVALAAD